MVGSLGSVEQVSRMLRVCVEKRPAPQQKASSAPISRRAVAACVDMPQARAASAYKALPIVQATHEVSRESSQAQMAWESRGSQMQAADRRSVSTGRRQVRPGLAYVATRAHRQVQLSGYME